MSSRTLSLDLRERVVAAVSDTGILAQATPGWIATRLAVSSPGRKWHAFAQPPAAPG